MSVIKFPFHHNHCRSLMIYIHIHCCRDPIPGLSAISFSPKETTLYRQPFVLLLSVHSSSTQVVVSDPKTWLVLARNGWLDTGRQLVVRHARAGLIRLKQCPR